MCHVLRTSLSSALSVLGSDFLSFGTMYVFLVYFTYVSLFVLVLRHDFGYVFGLFYVIVFPIGGIEIFVCFDIWVNVPGLYTISSEIPL